MRADEYLRDAQPGDVLAWLQVRIDAADSGRVVIWIDGNKQLGGEYVHQRFDVEPLALFPDLRIRDVLRLLSEQLEEVIRVLLVTTAPL